MATPRFLVRDNVLAIAANEYDSVIALTQALIRIPTRGGIDSYDSILELMREWLAERGLFPSVLRDSDGRTVALVCEVRGSNPGPYYVLDACLDTAPFGDPSAWADGPTSAVIRDGWLYGRGAADSKSGAAIFAHIAATINSYAQQLKGRVTLLFDVDEHAGNFGGAKAFFEKERDVQGVMIGYPGTAHVVTGGRGVLRARIHVRGVSSHSGGTRPTPNAIVKAAELIQQLSAFVLPENHDGRFPRQPKLTVTKIEGGEGFSVTPDLCIVNVDIRLTPSFTAEAARKILENAVRTLDASWSDTSLTEIETVMHWPPYQLDDDLPMSSALISSAQEFGLSPDSYVAGPSNIGNYLSGLGIPATAGFGPVYAGLHATDECIELSSVSPVHATYLHAISRLLR